jgi:hypothetical protein
MRDALSLEPSAAAVSGRTGPSRPPRSLGVVWAAVGATGLAVAVGLALGRLPLNLYDVSFSLDWGSDIVHGLVPDVQVSGASTPHPLSIASGAVAALFGSSALDVMRAFLLVSTGVTGVALYRIGAIPAGRGVGVTAVGVLFLSEPFLYGTLGQATPSDLPSLAALLAALACELAKPRRGVAPLVLLSLAGLWRPEPWLLAGLYWAWAVRGQPPARKLRLGLIALSGPALWMGCDLAMTHNPLYSLTYTHESTLAAQRPTGLGRVAGTLRAVLTGYLGTPALIAALAGVALELFVHRLPRLLLALLVLTVLSFAVIGALHLPLDERYALPTTALLAVFFGHMVAGWWTLPHSLLRHVWMLAGVVAAGFVTAAVPHQLRALASDRTTFQQESAVVAELAALTHPARVRGALRACNTVATPYRVVPILAYDIGERPRTLTAQNVGIPARGTIVLPNSARAAALFETHRFLDYSLSRRGYRMLTQNASWKIWTNCIGSSVASTGSRSSAGHDERLRVSGRHVRCPDQRPIRDSRLAIRPPPADRRALARGRRARGLGDADRLA